MLLGGNSPRSVNGNLLLDKLFGSHIHWVGEHRKGEDIQSLASELKASGKKPYIVPYGGSNELGVMGFCHAMQELNIQCESKSLYTHIVFASSSGGTQAGLMLGNKLT